MSEPLQDEAEVLDGLPVLSGEPSGVSMFPAPASRALARPLAGHVQVAAVAAGGFVAGAAVVGLVQRRHSKRGGALIRGRASRRLGRAGKRSAGPVGELVQIVGTRSLLVDVHLLGLPDANR